MFATKNSPLAGRGFRENIEANYGEPYRERSHQTSL
jgi:hypothetical protein